MKYIGENAIEKLISLIKGDLAKKQDSITVSGLLKGDGTTISAAVAETDYMVPPTGGITGQVLKKTETGTEWADASFKPEGKSYLTFSSPNSFTLAVNDATKHWDGTLEYFTVGRTWTTWNGMATLSSVADGEYVLYLRGTGNTIITGNSNNYGWVLIGSDIACIGNIENLLDYATVESGEHPTMARYCYSYMFSGCTGLTQVPTLPATTLADVCYARMFQGCASLIQAPTLPATTLATSCYFGMFQGCTSLTRAPTLPATTLANYCYFGMFQGCTSLTQAPTLPATTLANGCYTSMFQDCTSLKLSSTQTGEYTVAYCIPTTGTGTTATNALTDMFSSTGGTFTGTPEINTTYYLSNDSDVFISTYGETTCAEMEAAYQAGKLLVMRNGNLTAHLYRRYNELQFAFNTVGRIFKCSWDSWSSQTFESTPSKHASKHASGGTDPITPESIGASPASHAEDTAIHLPTVTADDNGKFLCVVNGAWAAVAYPSAENSTF